MAKRTHSESFKLQVIQEVKLGKSMNQTAKDNGLSVSVVSSWVKAFNGTKIASAKELLSDEQKEIIELKKKLKRAELERDILKEAALIFGKK